MTLRSRVGRVKRSARALTRTVASLGADPADTKFGIELDYPVDPKPRYGYELPAHPQLLARISAQDDHIGGRLRAIVDQRDALLAIPLDAPDPSTPWWHNGWYGGLDAAALYTFLVTERPSRMIEVGSGNSTKFARRAVTDHHLATQLTSIDPHPRAEVDALCDRVVRTALEDTDLSVFRELTPGDICFMDGSHRAFMNSDATVFFTEVVPALPAGVLVHVHDCFLPWDYPPQIRDWYWSEHYLLACWLLAGGLEVELPNFYVSTRPELFHVLDPVFDRFTWSATPTNGTGFWFRTT